MEVQDEANQVHEGLDDNVMDSLGVHEDLSEVPQGEYEDNHESKGSTQTLSVQKRLKSQRRAHEREVRDLHARIGDLESRMTQPMQSHDSSANPYESEQTHGNIDEHIHKAVSYALQHKEMEERKALEAKNHQHVKRQYQEFEKHLDHMGDKYDDFHDVVYGDHTPYTETMRDYAMTLPRSGKGSAGEVLYKLGQNPDELARISKLHPLDQSSEMSRLSHALIGNAEGKAAQQNRPLGQIKSNPVSNHRGVNEKTPVSDIRKSMKSGTFK
jgi:hypothetical protein